MRPKKTEAAPPPFPGRPPILQQQRLGQKIPGGFVAYELCVKDWDHQWWRLTDRWEKLKVRRNLLLTSASGSSKLDSSSQATAEE